MYGDLTTWKWIEWVYVRTWQTYNMTFIDSMKRYWMVKKCLLKHWAITQYKNEKCILIFAWTLSRRYSIDDALPCIYVHKQHRYTGQQKYKHIVMCWSWWSSVLLESYTVVTILRVLILTWTLRVPKVQLVCSLPISIYGDILGNDWTKETKGETVVFWPPPHHAPHATMFYASSLFGQYVLNTSLNNLHLNRDTIKQLFWWGDDIRDKIETHSPEAFRVD